MTSILKVDRIESRESGGNVTLGSPVSQDSSISVLAHIVMTSDQTNRTEQQWNKMKFDSALIDTKSGFDNSDDRYTIPVAGYYRIYAQAFLGVDGESNSTRDSGICVTRTRSGIETQLAFSVHRHYNGSTDTSDVTENVYIIDNCQVGDYIQFYSYVNTDTGTAYDVFADIDAADDNTHLNDNLPGIGSGEDRSTYFTIERILA